VLVPEDWRCRAQAAIQLLAIPAFGVGMALFLICEWALRKVGLGVLRPQPAGTILICPECRSAHLEPHGGTSVLDGRTRMHCRGCGLLLDPRRSQVFLAFVFALSLLVTVTCLRLVGLHPFTLILLPGLVLGPAGMIISAQALLSRTRAAQPLLASLAQMRSLRRGAAGLRARTVRYEL
jgi:hypothetical protein